jgi:hypothetical protein
VFIPIQHCTVTSIEIGYYRSSINIVLKFDQINTQTTMNKIYHTLTICLLLLFCTLLFKPCITQSDSSIEWISTGTSIDIIDIARVIVNKTTGDNYATGYFFNNITFQGNTVQGSDDYNALLYKYNSDGELQWFKVLSTTRGCLGIDVALGQTGVYMVGTYAGDFITEVDIEGVDVPGDSQQSQGFIAKYSLDGELLYIRYIGNGGYATVLVFSAKVDPVDDQLVVGVEYRHNVTLGNTAYEAYGFDMNIAKIRDDGEIIWAHASEGEGSETIWEIDINDHGVICAFGIFTNDFHGLQVVQGDTAVWIMEMDSKSGEILWTTSVNITGEIQLAGAVISNTSSCRVVGSFGGSIQFNENVADSFDLDLFYINLNSDGDEVAFSTSAAVNGSVFTRDVACDDLDNCWIVGDWDGDIEYYDNNGQSVFEKLGVDSAYILKLNPDGYPVDAVTSSVYAEAHSADVDHLGSVYVAGEYFETTIWGEHNITVSAIEYGTYTLKLNQKS